MAANSRISQCIQKIIFLENTNYEVAKKEAREEYWKAFDEEMAKDPFNGWFGWEDPIDNLIDAVDRCTDVEWVSFLLCEYKRYVSVVRKYRKFEINQHVVNEAEAYIVSRT